MAIDSSGRTLGVGVIGCGNISTAYFRLAPLFRGVAMRACADINMDAARKRAAQFGLRAETVEELLADPEVDIVVNLTVPAVHYAVTRQALEAGKHVYSEKPFVLSVEEGLEIKRIADERGLRVGSAPDTYLGGAHQEVRALVDSGRLGRITSGTCFVMSFGMEHWHPNPDFFFQPGAGPVLDVGPYYVAELIQLIGPVRRVGALTAIPRAERTILSQPRAGEKIPVGTPTTIHGLLEFASGAVITMNASWDVWKHGHAPIELYGSEGTIYVPDPNFFGGDVKITEHQHPVETLPDFGHPFSVPNDEHPDGVKANYRTVGLADMAVAILEGRPHRCSLESALHAVEVMTGLLRSGETGQFVAMQTTCERPAALPPEEARALLADPDAAVVVMTRAKSD
jgi:predicted dehydrogenase